MPIVEVPGARLSYDVAGTPSAPAIAFVHAGVATRAMWDPQFDDLARDHYVIRYDTRGYGESRGDDVEFADRNDLIAVLDAAGASAACLVGCSRGGRIALDAALDAPDRVTGLVTIGSTPGGQEQDGATDRELEMLADMKAASDREDIDALVRTEVAFWDLGPSRDIDDVDPEFLQRAIELNVGAAHWDFAGLDQPLDPPAISRLHEITIPALVVVGDLDVTESKLGYELLMAGLPQAEGLRFADSAHLPSVERAEQFTSDLRALFRAASGSSLGRITASAARTSSAVAAMPGVENAAPAGCRRRFPASDAVLRIRPLRRLEGRKGGAPCHRSRPLARSPSSENPRSLKTPRSQRPAPPGSI